MTCPTKTLLNQRVTSLARKRQAFIDETLRANPKSNAKFTFVGDNPLPYMG